MAQTQTRSPLGGTLSSIGWPLVYGAGASSIFYLLVLRGPLGTELVVRYFASHPVGVATTIMFFVGLAALVLKLADVHRQLRWLDRTKLATPPPDGEPAASAHALLADWARLASAARNSYLGQRLRHALEHVRRTDSGHGLHEELKYLADSDAAQQQDSHALVRIVIWATPMLGFLGTVIGITRALGDLNPVEMASSMDTAMRGLLSGLYVAFDTTALALTLSIVLMFVQFLVDRLETQLLAAVDEAAERQLAGRFSQSLTTADPHVATVQRMCQTVIKTTEQLVERQAALWQTTVESANARWSELAGQAGQQLQASLAGALDGSLQTFASRMAESEQAAAERATLRHQQWQTTLSENARLLRDQQAEMLRHAQLLERILSATADVQTLESSLNENLRALAGTRHFEDTVMSLSAAIHLLTTRLPHDGARIEPAAAAPAGKTSRSSHKGQGQGRAA